MINAAGLIVEDEETGVGRENVLLKTKIKLSETLLGLEKQLGFTPVTRNSVIIPDQEDAAAAEFLELLRKNKIS